MDNKYKIALKVGNSSFELESSDLKWLEKKEKEYLAKFIGKTEDNESSISSETAVKPVIEIPKGSVNEFYKLYIKKNKITTRPSIAVFFVYYLEKIAKKNNIKTGNITDCFKNIGYPNYNTINMADVLNNAKKRALLNYVNKYWTLTITGMDYVLNKIN